MRSPSGSANMHTCAGKRLHAVSDDRLSELVPMAAWLLCEPSPEYTEHHHPELGHKEIRTQTVVSATVPAPNRNPAMRIADSRDSRSIATAPQRDQLKSRTSRP